MSQKEQETTTSGQSTFIENLKQYVKNLEDFLIQSVKQEVIWDEVENQFVVVDSFLTNFDKRRILDEIKLWQRYLEAH